MNKKPPASLKILMPEVLPTPSVTSTTAGRESPRTRAQRRLEQLAKKAALAGAASSLSACIGFGVVDPLPEPPQDCAPDDDPNRWVSVGILQTVPQLVVQLNVTEDFTFVRGVSIGANVDVTGGTLAGVVVDDPNNIITVTVDVDEAAPEVVLTIDTACAGEVRPLEVVLDAQTGGFFVRDP